MRFLTALTLLLVITLVGCLHDEDDGPTLLGSLVDQAIGGIWEGTDSDGTAIIALTTESGRLHWIAETGEQGFGTGSVIGSAVTFN